MNTLLAISRLNNLQSSQGNTLLSTLSVVCYQRLCPYLQLTRLELGDIIHDSISGFDAKALPMLPAN
jgi:hypothetical protein